MIWESRPWKRKLDELAGSLLRQKKRYQWTETWLAKIEFDIFLSGYVIRKLLEANKISDEMKSAAVRVKVHMSRPHSVDKMNWHKLDKLYDLSKREERNISLRDFSNQLIHSFVFVPSILKNGRLRGFYVASDKEKNRCVYYFDIDSVISLFRRVVDDGVVRAEMYR